MREKGKHLLLGLVYMICIISASVILTLSFKPLYYFDVAHLNLVKQSGIPKEEIIENYDALIDYNLNPFIKELKFPSLAMSETGRIHFVEVKQIFTGVEILFVVSLVVVILGTLYMRKRKQHSYLKMAGILTILVPLILGCLVALNWDQFFVTFHHIFFNNDYWIFDAVTDPVITILPDTFFLHCAIMILGGIVLGAGICFGIYKRVENKK